MSTDFIPRADIAFFSWLKIVVASLRAKFAAWGVSAAGSLTRPHFPGIGLGVELLSCLGRLSYNRPLEPPLIDR
jgi:hypothetical protein